MDARIARTAERQHGVIKTSSRSVALEPAMRGVRRISGAPQTFEQRVLAATLAIEASVASHRTAGQLWGLARMTVDVIDVLIPAGRTSRVGGVRVHRSRTLEDADLTRLRGIPI